ncbi:class A sortase [Streptococcus sp. CSL10205-OR2]|uniref:class A sortase n=1 Tax=Streptococcus sp. CSL10205-OR2 TaxID=2980558 RepID=UPI0021DB707F|nr:class A sortase [Streptococcus sp. CSL10205-OR2]MCU9533278.1 class A sortase [Streptococcus sp. CSL10205-OR2]
MNRRKKRSTLKRVLLNTLVFLLLLVGLALIFNKPIRNTLIAWNTNKYQVTKVDKKEIDKNKKAKSTFKFEDVESLNVEAVLAAQMNAQDLPVIGGIAIPELELNLPIFKGLDNVALSYGAGTMKEDQVMGQGNYALASHHVFGLTGSSQMLFSPLDNAKEGMKIYLTDKEKVYVYTINMVEQVTPDRVDVVYDVEGKNQITLVTCTDAEATYRTIVYGELTEEIAFDDADQSILKAFEKQYNQISL